MTGSVLILTADRACLCPMDGLPNITASVLISSDSIWYVCPKEGVASIAD